MKRRLTAGAFAAALALTAFAGTALAGSHQPTTPNGWVGACNMMEDESMLTIPMVHNATQGTHGNDGMARAVDRSGDCV